MQKFCFLFNEVNNSWTEVRLFRWTADSSQFRLGKSDFFIQSFLRITLNNSSMIFKYFLFLENTYILAIFVPFPLPHMSRQNKFNVFNLCFISFYDYISDGDHQRELWILYFPSYELEDISWPKREGHYTTNGDTSCHIFHA